MTAASAPPRSSRAFGDAAAIATLIATWAAFHLGVLAGGVYFFRDVYAVDVATQSVAAWARADGDAPLWNPFMRCGQPLLANPNAAANHPLSLLYAFMPPVRGVTWFIALHRLVLPLSTYVLARFLGQRPPGAVVSALALGFGGLAASSSNLYVVAATLAWSPLAIAALIWAIEGGGLTRTILAAAAWALLYLSGEPFTMAMTGLVTLLLLGARAHARGTAGATLRRTLLVGGPAAAGAVALVAVNLLPSVELLRLSRRGEGLGYPAYAHMSLPPVGLVEMVVPGFAGDVLRLESGAFWGSSRYDLEFPYYVSLYLGAAALLLPFLGITLFRPGGRSLALLAATGIVLALGSHAGINAWVYRIAPPLWMLRHPVKWAYLTALALALLAGMSWDRLTAAPRVPRAWLAGTLLGAALLLAAGLLQPAALRALLAELFPSKEGGMAAEAVAAAVGAGLVRTGLAWLALGLLVGLVSARNAHAPWATAALALVIAGDLAWTARLAPTTDVSFYDAGRAAATLAGATPSRPARLAAGLGTHPRPGRLAAPSNERLWHFHWLASALHPYSAVHLGFRYSLDEDADNLQPPWTRALWARIQSAPEASRIEMLGRAATEYHVGFEETDPPGTVLVGVLPTGSERPVRLRRIAGALPWASMEDGTAVELRHFGPCRFRFRVQAAAAGLLVVRETWFPGWSAEVDGASLAVRQHEIAFMAVPVPAGSHEVELRYLPRSYVVGRAISLGALAVLGALLVASVIRERRR